MCCSVLQRLEASQSLSSHSIVHNTLSKRLIFMWRAAQVKNLERVLATERSANTQVNILTSQLAAKFAVKNDSRADFLRNFTSCARL